MHMRSCFVVKGGLGVMDSFTVFGSIAIFPYTIELGDVFATMIRLM